MNDYERLFFKGIFPEDSLKKFIDELEIIWNKNETGNTGISCTVDEDDGN
jgi:hypothetical protein